METFLFVVLIISGLTLVPCLLLFFRLLTRMNSHQQNPRWFDRLAEFCFVGLFPVSGIYLFRSECDIHPFDLESLPTAYSISALVTIAYYASRVHKERLSPLLLLFVASLLVGGLLFSIVICIHFSSNVLIVLFPIFNLFFLTPLFYVLYLIRELIHLNTYLSEQCAKFKNSEGAPWVFYEKLGSSRFAFVLYLLLPFAVMLQAILYLFGQKPDSIISEFTASCGFLLSNSQQCSCGGDHYLCSVAASGTPKLVRPVRMGWRKGEKIKVNRQLLVANAFENWLEESTPRLHKLLRKSYDACDIPVNRWSKHQRWANIIYLMMKPLEWLFLLWLYLVDQKPENRISLQYLPKHDFIQFKTKKHEKTTC